MFLFVFVFGVLCRCCDVCSYFGLSVLCVFIVCVFVDVMSYIYMCVLSECVLLGGCCCFLFGWVGVVV